MAKTWAKIREDASCAADRALDTVLCQAMDNVDAAWRAQLGLKTGESPKDAREAIDCAAREDLTKKILFEIPPQYHRATAPAAVCTMRIALERAVDELTTRLRKREAERDTARAECATEQVERLRRQEDNLHPPALTECPGCRDGGTPLVTYGFPHWFVECQKCGIRGPSHPDGAKAIRAWGAPYWRSVTGTGPAQEE